MRKALVLVFALATASTFVTSAVTPRATTVVAKKSFLNQVGHIPTTTLYQPKADGDYRVSIYLTSPAVTGTGVSNDWILVVPSWTDDSGTWPSQYFGVNGIPFLSTNNGQTLPSQAGGTAVIHVKKNTPIQVMDGGSGDVTDTYNVFVTVEKL